MSNKCCYLQEMSLGQATKFKKKDNFGRPRTGRSAKNNKTVQNPLQ